MTKTKLSRGLRNNNPLNIRHSASRWQGSRVEQTDKAFVQFTSMTMGYRAAWRILETYYKHFEGQHKPFTPRNIIYRWAPPNENDSEAYLKSVCRLTNLAGNEALKQPSKVSARSSQSFRSSQSLQPLLNDAYTARDPQAQTKLIDLLAAMTCVENGITMKEVNREAIEKGLLLVSS